MGRIWSGIVLLLVSGQAVWADDWTIHITVDNQYDVYFGDAVSTDYFAGGDGDWHSTETWIALNRDPNDFLYVATSSDYSIAQGFLAEFINTTQNVTILTGSSVWEVFPAGAYLQQINPSWPATWPASLMPTQAEVDQAIAFATSNNLWVTPVTAPGYSNGASPLPWGTRSGISPAAQWIWHDSGKSFSGLYPVPFAGFNHDEFLVFRVPNVPEPTTAALVVLTAAYPLLCRNRPRRRAFAPAAGAQVL